MIIAVSVLAGLGLVAGLGLAIAARIFAVEIDPRQERVADILPGANCGGCGFAGCNDFAAAIVKGLAAPDDCPAGGAETARAVAEIMGLTVDAKARKVALVLCQGTDDLAPKRFHYNGSVSCASAAQLGGGDKLCGYGCLGLGDCQRVCVFNAVEMNNGIASVFPERCTGCGKCVEACPRDIIKLVPDTSKVHILCNNKDKGAAAKRACKVACIGCRKCVKAAGEGEIEIDSFLARINYDNAPTDASLVGECPTGAIGLISLDGTALPEPVVVAESASSGGA